MFEKLIHLVSLLKLGLLSEKNKRNRFELFNSFALSSEPEKLGIILSKEVIDVATPQLEVEENLTIFGSNTFDKTALKVDLKWRPDVESELVTLKTQFSLEINNETLDFEELLTYVPKRDASFKNAFVQYGGNLSKLRVYVIDPLLNYRLCFAGYMTVRGEPSKKRYVSLNLLLKASSKVYDFKSGFNNKYVAAQFAANRNKAGLMGSLNSLIRQNRCENLCQIKGQISIDETTTKTTFFFWGFMSRHFIDSTSQKQQSKRLLAMFANGKAFHLGMVEFKNDLLDKSQQVQYGYTLLKGIALYPDALQVYKRDSVEWDKVSSDLIELKFDIVTRDTSILIEAHRRSKVSSFFDFDHQGRQGWLTVVLNDALDTKKDLLAYKQSIQTYLESVREGHIAQLTTTIRDKLVPELESRKPLVVSTIDDDCKFQQLVGAKAASLAQLYKLSKVSTTSFIVPKAVVLTKFAYEAFVSSNEHIVNEVKQLNGPLPDDVVYKCEQIEQSINHNNTQLPSNVLKELWTQISSVFDVTDLSDSLDGRRFAVRSSSWGEDEEGMSAAGQLTTVLNVSGRNNLISAIKTCFASKFSYTNIEYKRQHGLPLDMPMAVVIQEMVECDKAGVLFTCEPTGDRRFFTLTANYGLGESVVSGVANPDSIKVEVGDNLDLEIIVEKVIGKKEIIFSGPESQLSLNNTTKSDLGSGNNLTTVEHPDYSIVELKSRNSNFDRSKCCLEDSEIIFLVRCAKEQLEYFQSLRDIEFGFKDAQMFMFQSRPVTGIDSLTEYELIHEFDNCSRHEIDWLTRANIGEVCPYPISPLCLTTTMHHIDLFKTRVLNRQGQIFSHQCSPIFSNIFRIDSYNLFFSMVTSEILQGKGLPPLVKKGMELSLFGREINLPELEDICQDALIDIPKYYWLWTKLDTIKFKLNPWSRLKKTRKSLEAFKMKLKSDNYMDNKSLDSLLFFEELFDLMYESLNDHLMISQIGSEVNFKLMLILTKYTDDATLLFTAMSKVLGSAPDILSAEIPARIESMANLLKRKGDAESFASMSNIQILDYISKNDDFSREFNSFIIKFGHRSYHEFDIHTKRWDEDPSPILEQIKLNCSGPETKPKLKTKSLDEIIELTGFKFSFGDRFKLKHSIIEDCQKYVTFREQTKDMLIDYVALQRAVMVCIGKRLVKLGRLPDEDMIFFLKQNDLAILAQEHDAQLVMRALRRWRLFETKFNIEWRYEQIEKGYEYIPMHLRERIEIEGEGENLLETTKLVGTTACCGSARGKVCIVDDYKQLFKVKPNDILVVHSSDIAFSPVFPIISGLVTEVGGLISHGAVVAREYGLPCLIGVESATKIFQDGELVLLDADKGCVLRLEMVGKGEIE